jgi:SAM-dependent methyltransferase
MTKDMRKLVREGYEKIDYVEAYRSNSEPNDMEKNFLNKLIKLIPKHAKILDLGSGTGIPFDKYLVAQGFDMTGIDFSQKQIVLARKNVPEAKYIKDDFSAFDFEKESFHAIVSFYAIFHIPRDEHKILFAKMNKFLKKEGIVLLSLGSSGSEYGEEEDWFGAPMAWSSYDPDTSMELIKESGFNILDSFFEGEPGDDEYHFWVIAKKK